MHNKTLSKILVVPIRVSSVSAATVSSNVLTVFAEPVTLEDILAEIEALDGRLDEIEAIITALNSALDSLKMNNDLQSSLDSLSNPAATSDDLDATRSDLSGNIGSLKTLVIVAIGLALIAAAAAIAAVYLILRKIAKTPN